VRRVHAGGRQLRRVQRDQTFCGQHTARSWRRVPLLLRRQTSREERDYGTEGLTARQRDDSRKEGNPGGDTPRNRGLQPTRQLPSDREARRVDALASSKLVTPIGGTVLDPFTGSGTTGMACRYEHRQFIGIEKEADYVAIAERRIAAVAPLFGEASA
jgi:hypothetical protein